MRDGSLICVGKGNDDWNHSAPHGAGRLMSRAAAFRQLDMDQYEAEMAGVFSTCVVRETLDESPMAYKPIDEIMAQVTHAAEIVERIRPVYNFKASEQGALTSAYRFGRALYIACAFAIIVPFRGVWGRFDQTS